MQEEDAQSNKDFLRGSENPVHSDEQESRARFDSRGNAWKEDRASEMQGSANERHHRAATTLNPKPARKN